MAKFKKIKNTWYYTYAHEEWTAKKLYGLDERHPSISFTCFQERLMRYRNGKCSPEMDTIQKILTTPSKEYGGNQHTIQSKKEISKECQEWIAFNKKWLKGSLAHKMRLC